MIKEELCIICIRKNITWPEMFKRFIKDSSMMDSESLKSNKNNFLDGLMNLTTCGKIFL